MGVQLRPQQLGSEIDRGGGAPPFHAETFSDGIAEPPPGGRSDGASDLAQPRAQARDDLVVKDVPEARPVAAGADQSFFAALTPAASPEPVTGVRVPAPETIIGGRAGASRASDPAAPLRARKMMRVGQIVPLRRESLSARRGLVAGTTAALALIVVAAATGPRASAPLSASASASTTIAVVRPIEIHVPAPTVVVRKTVVRRIVGRKAALAPATLPSSSPSPPPPPAAETAPAPAPRVPRPPSAAPQRSDEPSSFGGEFSP